MQNKALILKKNPLMIIAYLLFAIGLMLLAHAVYLFVFPQNSVEMKPLPKELTSWDKERICSRTEPSPLFINFYGNKKEEWIAILLGREKEFARIFIIPMTVNGINVIRYAVTEAGLKQISALNEAEAGAYLDKFNFTPEEDLFFRYCIYKVLPDYWNPRLPSA